MVLGENDGRKGRAARAGGPVSALDPAALTQNLLGVPFRAGLVRRRGYHVYFARSDISNGEKKCLLKRGPTSDVSHR
jgi:hypothetical protein